MGYRPSAAPRTIRLFRRGTIPRRPARAATATGPTSRHSTRHGFTSQERPPTRAGDSIVRQTLSVVASDTVVSPFKSFEAFCVEKHPWGLGYRLDVLDAVVAERKARSAQRLAAEAEPIG